MKQRRTGLTWGLSVSVGASLGLVLGVYVPSWGVVLAPPAAMLVLGAGLLHLPEDERIAVALRILMGFTLGFVPLTGWIWFWEMRDMTLQFQATRAAAEEVFAEGLGHMCIRWALMLSLLPFGGWTLWKRRRRMVD